MVKLTSRETLTKVFNGTDPCVLTLSNDAHTLTTLANGQVSSFVGAETTLNVYKGTAVDTANWTLTVQQTGGLQGTLTGNVYKVTGLTSDQGTAVFTATPKNGSETVLHKVFSVSKAKEGQTTALTTVLVEKGVIKKYKDRLTVTGAKPTITSGITFDTSALKAEAYKKQGDRVVPTTGYWEVTTEVASTSGSTKTVRYTSTAPEGRLTYNLPREDLLTIQVKIYQDAAKQTLLDQETVDFIQDGDPTITLVNTNPNVILPASPMGEVTNYTAGAGALEVYEGTLNVTSLCTFKVLDARPVVQVTAAGTFSVANVPTTTDIVRNTLVATYRGKEFTSSVTIAKTKAGATGSAAKLLYLTADNQVFVLDKDGSPKTEFLTVRALLQNVEGDATFTVQGIKPDGKEEAIAVSPTSNTIKLPGRLGQQYLRVKVTATLGSLTDVMTLSVVKDGTPAVTSFLTNEAVTLAATNSGVISAPSYALATGFFKVYEGSTDVSATASYSITPISGVTATIKPGGAYAVTAIPDNLDSVALTLTATYKSASFSRVFSISKSKMGEAGADAKMVILQATQDYFKYGSDGTPTPVNQVIDLTANLINIQGQISWGVLAYKNDNPTPKTINLPVRDNSVTLDTTHMGEYDYLKVMVSVQESDAYYRDSRTISKVVDGSKTLVGWLSNESITVPALPNGFVKPVDMARLTGLFKVFYGSEDVTQDAVFDYVKDTDYTFAITSTGSYKVTALVQGFDSFAIPIRATYKGKTIEKVLSVSKSKSGIDGSSSYMWVLYATDSTGANAVDTPAAGQEGTYKYIGIATTRTPEKPASTSGSYTWTLIKGADGIGVNGRSVHIKYSNDGGRTFTANNGETAGDYMGIYVDDKLEDSSRPSDYTWNRTKGDRGENGLNAAVNLLPGFTRGFGTTYRQLYTHIGTMTVLADGWVKCYYKNTSNQAERFEFNFPKPEGLSVNQDYTFLQEVRNNKSSHKNMFFYFVMDGGSTFFGNAGNPDCTMNFSATVPRRSVRQVLTHMNKPLDQTTWFFQVNCNVEPGQTLDVEYRVSAYLGNYQGPYVPYQGGKPGATGDAGKGLRSSTQYYVQTTSLENMTLPRPNLLLNADNPTMGNGVNGTWSVRSNGNGTVELLPVDNPPRPEIQKMLRVKDNTNGGNKDLGTTFNLEVGQKYTISVWARVSKTSTQPNVKLLMRHWANDTGDTYKILVKVIDHTDWRWYSFTLTVNSNVGGTIQFGQQQGGNIEICGMRCVKGERDDPWTTTPPILTPEQPYLWSYRSDTYTDNTSTTTPPTIIGVHGQDGNSVKVFSSSYRYAQNLINQYSTAGYKGAWSVTESTAGTKVGDIVHLKVFNTTKNADSWVVLKVLRITNDKTLHGVSAGVIEKGEAGPQGPQGPQGTPGEDAITAILTNDSTTITTTPTGVLTSQALLGATTVMKLYKGTREITNLTDWTFSGRVTNGTATFTNTVATFNVTGLTTDTAILNITASHGTYGSFSKDFSIGRIKAGEPAVFYTLEPSTLVFSKNPSGTFSPANVKVKVKKTEGSNVTELDRVKLQVQEFDVAGTKTKEASKAEIILANWNYTPQPAAKYLIITAYDKDTDTKVLDSQSIQIVKDGTDSYSMDIGADRGFIFSYDKDNLSVGIPETTLTPRFTGNFTPTTYAWTKNGNPVTGSSGVLKITAEEMKKVNNITVGLTVTGTTDKGTATLVSYINVTKVKDGDDTYQVSLTKEVAAFPTNENGVLLDTLSNNTTQVKVYRGTVEVAPIISKVVATGCQATYSGATVTLTSLTAESGYVDIEVKAAGTGVLGVKRFSFVKVRQGQTMKFYQAWAMSADGTDGFSTTESIGKKYLGTYTSTNPTQSTNPRDYRWVETSNAFTLGGRNYLLNSDFVEDHTGWMPTTANSVTYRTDTDSNRYIHLEPPADRDTAYWNRGMATAIKGDTVIVSGYGRQPKGDPVRGFLIIEEKTADDRSVVLKYFGPAHTGVTWSSPTTHKIGTEWNRFVVTYKVTEAATRNIKIAFIAGVGNIWEIKFPKLEVATVASAWSANPEDVYRRLNVVRDAANQANAELANIASDSKLTPVEKQQVAREIETIKSEVPILIAQATQYSITTEKDAFNSRYTALMNLVNPLLARMNETSAITTATFKAAFKDYYVAKTALMNKIYVVLKDYTTNESQAIKQELTQVKQDIDAWKVSVSQTFLTKEGAKAYATLERLSSEITAQANAIKLAVAKDYLTKGEAASKYATLEVTNDRINLAVNGQNKTSLTVQDGSVTFDLSGKRTKIGSYKAYAWSPDGRDRFSRTVPGENMLLHGSGSEEGFVWKAQIPTNRPHIASKVIKFSEDNKTLGELGFKLGDVLTASFKCVITGSPDSQYFIFKFDGLNREACRTLNSNPGTYYIKNTIILDDALLNSCRGLCYIIWDSKNRTNVTANNRQFGLFSQAKIEVGSNPNPVWSLNSKDSYDQAVPRYMGTSSVDSDDPANYVWELNPARTPMSIYTDNPSIPGGSLYPPRPNLVPNSGFSIPMRNNMWTHIEGYDLLNGERDAPNERIATRKPTSNDYMYVGNHAARYNPIVIPPFNSVTISFDYKEQGFASNSQDFNFCYLDVKVDPSFNGNVVVSKMIKRSEIPGISTTNQTTWIRPSVTLFNDTTVNVYYRPQFYLAPKNNNVKIFLRKVKVELGTYATPWIPKADDRGTDNSILLKALDLIPKYKTTSMLPPDPTKLYEWGINPDWAEAAATLGLNERLTVGDFRTEQQNLVSQINERATADELNKVKSTAEGVSADLKDYLKPDTGKHDRDLKAAKEASTKQVSDLEERVVSLKFSNMITKFGNDGITLSGTDKTMQVRITNSRLEFVENEIVTAYITGKKFHISNGAVTDSFQVGQHLFQRYNDDHTIVKWIN